MLKIVYDVGPKFDGNKNTNCMANPARTSMNHTTSTTTCEKIACHLDGSRTDSGTCKLLPRTILGSIQEARPRPMSDVGVPHIRALSTFRILA